MTMLYNKHCVSTHRYMIVNLNIETINTSMTFTIKMSFQ